MILSSGTKKPKIHPSAYVAPSATISGEVTIGQGCAILHGAVITAEGAPIAIGADCVVMEHAVVRASGGSATRFPTAIGNACIVGPGAYVVGATIGNGCFIASGARVFNGATMGDGSGVALGGIVHVNAQLAAGASVPMQHIAYGSPAKIAGPEQAAQIAAGLRFFENVFNIEQGPKAREQAARAYAQFLRKSHAQDTVLDAHTNRSPGRRQSGDELASAQVPEVDTVVDVMMLELQEMELRRQESQRKKSKH